MSNTDRELQVRVVIAGILAALVVACGAKLPDNFGELPLERQVKAYEDFFKHGGISSAEGSGVISSQGFSAAEAMVPYLTGEDQGIPVEEAVHIIWNVQLKGCPLHGTQAEAALKGLALQPLEEPLKGTVNAALESIEKDVRYPGRVDLYGSGACGRSSLSDESRGRSGDADSASRDR